MRPILTALLALTLLEGLLSAKDIKYIKAASNGINIDDVPASVISLVSRINSSDMNRILLSEDKNSRWLITEVQILDDDLVRVTLSDGNGVETVLCDHSPKKEWSIIRRTPIGDAKPAKDRKGDRLTVIPLPTSKAEQVMPSDGQKPSTHESATDPTAPADAH